MDYFFLRMPTSDENMNNFHSFSGLHPDARLRLSRILGLDGHPPILGIKRTKFYSLIAEGKLPPPQKIGSASLWRLGDLMAAVERLTAESQGGWK